MRSATILNSVALAMVAGAGLVVGFSAYSSYMGRQKHPLDADVEAVMAGTDKPQASLPQMAPQVTLPAPLPAPNQGSQSPTPTPATVPKNSPPPNKPLVLKTLPTDLATDDETELARRRAEAIANNPALAQRNKEGAALDAEITKAQEVVVKFLASPTAETSEKLDAVVTRLRKPEMLRNFGIVPLYAMYRTLNSLGALNAAETWEDRLKTLDQWRELSPQSSAPLIAKAGTLIHYAWKARGSGTVDTVTEGGAQKFLERIAEALAALEKASDLDELDADFYRCRVTIEMASGGDRDVVFEAVRKGSKLAPEYFDLYEAAANFFLPRWHGEPGDGEELANKLYDDIGGEIGKLAFLHVAKFVHELDRQTLTMGKYDRDKMRGAIELVFTTPQSRPIILFCGECCWSLQDPHLAVRFYERTKNIPRKELTISALDGTRFLAQADEDFHPGDHIVWLPYGVGKIDFSPDGKILAVPTRAMRRPAIVAISTEAKAIVGALPPEEGGSTWCRFAGKDGTGLLYDSDDNKTCHFVLRSLRRPDETLIFDNVDATQLISAISDDGSRLVAVERMTGRGFVWDGKSGVKKREFQAKPFGETLFFTPDNRFILGGSRELKLYDPDSETVLDLLEAFPKREWDLSKTTGMHAGGGVLLATSNYRKNRTEQWRILDLASRELKEIPLTAELLRISRLSADGRYLAYLTGAGKTFLTVYDTQLNKTLLRRSLFHENVADFAISPDGSMVAVADGFHLIRFYDIKPEENAGK